MKTLSRTDLEALVEETRRNLRFCVRAAGGMLLAHIVSDIAAFELLSPHMGEPHIGAGLQVSFFGLRIVSILALLLGVTAVAATYPLSRQSGRLARVLEVACRSDKDSVSVGPIGHPLADSLRVICIGMFVIWWIGIALVRSPMEFHYAWISFSSDWSGSSSWPIVPGIDWSGTFVFVAYVAWLLADTALQSRREPALLTAWLSPVEG